MPLLPDSMQNPQIITARQRAILEQLAGRDELAIVQLSDILQVSGSTLRRELTAMEETGLVVRTHGGVRSHDPIRYEPSFEKRAAEAVQAKRQIAIAAKQLIKPSMVVGVSGGTTCTELARQMRPMDQIAIVTNAVNVALELQSQTGNRVMMTGGMLMPSSYELVGAQVALSLEYVHFDVSFVGVSGIGLDFGFSATDEPEAVAGRALMASADRKVIIADHTKIGQITFARMCRLTEVDLLITDSGTSPEQIKALEKAGLQVLVAEPEI